MNLHSPIWGAIPRELRDHLGVLRQEIGARLGELRQPAREQVLGDRLVEARDDPVSSRVTISPEA